MVCCRKPIAASCSNWKRPCTEPLVSMRRPICRGKSVCCEKLTLDCGGLGSSRMLKSCWLRSRTNFPCLSMAMNNTLTSFTRALIVTTELESMPGAETSSPLGEFTYEFCPFNGEAAKSERIRQELQSVYFILSPPKNCTKSHGQRLPQLFRCKWLAERAGPLTPPFA